MTISDRNKLIAADTLARVVVYGPLAAAAVVFAPPALIVLALAAAQPWLGDGLGRAALWAEKKYPKVMGPVDRLISRYAGMQWWKHAGVLITALGVAIIPTPAIAAHLPGFAKSILDAVGGANQAWAQFVLPFALATALPFATKMATEGFEWVFQKIPFLRDASIQRQQDRQDRLAQRQFERVQLRAPQPGAPDAPTPSVAIDGPATVATRVAATVVGSAALLLASRRPVGPARKGPHLRRVNTSGRERIVVERPRVMPEVLRIATPSRIEVPEPHNTSRPDIAL